MTLVYACIAPHGSELIPALAGGQRKLFGPTRKAMRILAAEMKSARPDTIVVATPHNLRLPKHIGVVISENSSGSLAENGREVRLKVKCDLELAGRVLEDSEKKRLPVVGANYGGLEGPLSDLAMDWGTLIPLWFFMKETGLKSKVLIVTPSRGIPLGQNYEFGETIGFLAESGRKRVAFVASADQAHAHSKKGPYGFSPRAKEYDAMVVRSIRAGKLSSVMTARQGLIYAAKPDSLWQMTVLAGVLSSASMSGSLVSYEVPTYFGMICAGFRRTD